MNVKTTTHRYVFKFSTTLNSFGPLLGMTSDVTFMETGSPHSHRSDLTAKFDQITSVHVKCSLSAGLYLHGDKGSSAIAAIPLAEATPGTVFSYRPVNMLEIDAPHLAGATVSTTNISIVAQDGEPLDTLTEFYQLVIEIVY